VPAYDFFFELNWGKKEKEYFGIDTKNSTYDGIRRKNSR
jgi:hypothetical protein